MNQSRFAAALRCFPSKVGKKWLWNGVTESFKEKIGTLGCKETPLRAKSTISDKTGDLKIQKWVEVPVQKNILGKHLF